MSPRVPSDPGMIPKAAELLPRQSRARKTPVVMAKTIQRRTWSKRLPIAQFFSYSSILIAVLAVVLAGKGVAGLQEAGMLDVRPLAALPRIEVLGVFPTWEGLMAQLLTLTAVVVGFWAAGRRAQAAARLRVEP